MTNGPVFKIEYSIYSEVAASNHLNGTSAVKNYLVSTRKRFSSVFM